MPPRAPAPRGINGADLETVNHSPVRSASIAILITTFACAALCQQVEVVSVKPNKSVLHNSSFRTSQGRLTATNISLRGLIVRAYGLKDYQVEGPDWLVSERFDVAATFPEALPTGPEKFTAAFQAMMRSMLADRFQLVVHREQKLRPVYALVTAKSGIKFKEAHRCDSHNQNSNNTRYVATCVSMDTFAAFLATRGRDLPADLPVLDGTGLQGFYDFTLDWVLDSTPSASNKAGIPTIGDSPSGATLPVALEEQLGLRLETRSASVDILVVDSALRVPSAN